MCEAFYDCKQLSIRVSRTIPIVAFALSAASAACAPTSAPTWHQEAGYRWRELEIPSGKPGFTRMDGKRTGVQFQNTVGDSALLRNRILGQGAGVALGDVDGDGLVDIFLARTEGCSALYRNLGGWRFQDVTKSAGVGACDRYSTGAAFADVDGDGDLDLLLLATAGPNAIFLNDGHGRFTERRDLGLDPTGKGGTTLTMADVDGDGRLDLYVANYKSYSVDDSLPPPDFSHMVRQIAPGRFEVVPEHQQDYKLVMRPDMGGLRLTTRGATDDFYLNKGGRFERVPFTSPQFRDSHDRPLASDSHRLKTEMPTHTPLPKRPGDMESQLQQQRNTLFVNRGDRTFAELSLYAGVQASGWSWSTMFLDVDLDGWQDILIANGHLWDIMDADTHERLQNQSNDADWRRVRWQFPPLHLKNVAFRNRGNLTFEDVSARWRFGTEDDISHTMAAADLDGDGDLDVVVNRLGSPALLLRNDASAPRIAVRLIGDPPNTQAVASRIEVRGGAVPVQEHEVATGGLYMSHSDYLASFATGSAPNVTIVVHWRDGRQSVIEHAHPNRLFEITTASASPNVASDSIRKPQPALFEDATPELGGHTHTEPMFDDWERQLLLPNALSQLGPGAAWFDIDGDGNEDLLIATGRGGRVR